MDADNFWLVWIGIGVVGLGLQYVSRNRPSRIVNAYETPRWRRVAEWQAWANRVVAIAAGVLFIAFGLTLRFAPHLSWLPLALGGTLAFVFLLAYIAMVYRRPRT